MEVRKEMSFSHQEETREAERRLCHHGNITKSGWCPMIWDSILCWPSTPPGELASIFCPNYIAGFDSQSNATKQCMSNGEWYWSFETNTTWSNYSQCYPTQLVTVLMDIPGVHSNNITLLKKYLPILKTISKVGYTVSFFTLVIAFFILAIIKKLRCPRNMLHMHTFFSFMMRAFMALLKDTLFLSGIGLASDIIKTDEKYWLFDEKKTNWHCKLFTSFWQYFILANYFWILMEGLYLHNLVFLALFTDANSSIAVYIGLGWGLPAIFVLGWVISRIILEDTLCWTTNQNPYLFLWIRIPTMLSILINFVLFVNIVRVLLSKLKCTVSEETQRYKRWARSTLVLVPLFGVHYTVFLGMSYSMGIDETVEIIWLFCDQSFASFQGFFVAVLYCFMNREVRAEVSRALRNYRFPRLRYDSRAAQRSSSVCSCNTSKFGRRRGKRPKWLAKQWPCFYHDREGHRSTHSMASTQDIATRGGSLASSRGYMDIVGNGSNVVSMDNHKSIMNHTSPLCSKYTDQSLLSFSSNVSEYSTNADKIRERYRWSDSECCQLAYELHNLQHQTYH